MKLINCWATVKNRWTRPRLNLNTITRHAKAKDSAKIRPTIIEFMKNLKSTFGAKIKLNKLEAARRQLETAIVLFFKGGDPISTHTLATASAEIIQGINSARGGNPMTFDLPAHVVKPEYKDFLRKKFRAPQNFFKHADRDPEEILVFNTESTVFFIFDAVEKYFELSGEKPPVFTVFSLWFRSRFPEAFFFTEDERRKFSDLIDYSAKTDKSKFFAEILPICFPTNSVST
jgi:hypothetical protein